MTIYVIGDSISIQYGPYLKSYLQGICKYSRKEGEKEALLNLDNPQGANGGDSSMVLSFLQSIAQKGGIHADLLLVNCGLHDIKTDLKTHQKQVPIEDYQRNLRSIVQTISSMKKPRMAWIRTTPCDENVHNQPGMSFHRYSADCRAYNETADKIMAEANIPTIDLYTFTSNLGDSKELYCDHVHFHEPIRQKQAAFIAGWINAFIARTT